MILKSKIADFFLRLAVCLVIGGLFGYLLSESSYASQPNKQDGQREPQQVVLVIPYGTADQVKAGVYNPSLPSDMTFVQGDVLVVKNEDKVAHQLGPLFVPPQTSSVLSLDVADHFSYACSFQPSKFLGLDVRQRVDTGLRMQAILAIGLPTGMMLAVYSYMIPFKKKKADKPVEAA